MAPERCDMRLPEFVLQASQITCISRPLASTGDSLESIYNNTNYSIYIIYGPRKMRHEVT